MFTHFPLELSVYVADVPARTSAPKETRWVAIAELSGEALPSLMRKVLAHALTADRIYKVKPGKDHIMTIQRHDAGPRMSKAVVHGDTVYLAGIVADAPKGKSMAEQTKSILSQIDGFLAKAGTDKSKLLSANIWITDMANFAEMNAVWDAWVSPGNAPARATVEAGLASPDYKVEIMVVAAR